MNNKTVVVRDKLKLFAKRKMTYQQAADYFNVSYSTIYKYAKLWNIKFIDGNIAYKEHRDKIRKVSIKEVFVNFAGGDTIEDVAKRFGVAKHRAIFAASLFADKVKKQVITRKHLTELRREYRALYGETKT